MNDAACGTHFSKCRFLVARRFRQRSLKIRQSSRKVFEKPENSSTWIGKQAFSRCTAPSLTTVYSHSYLLFDNVLITLIVFSPSLYFSSHTLYLSLPISLIQPLPPPQKKTFTSSLYDTPFIAFDLSFQLLAFLNLYLSIVFHCLSSCFVSVQFSFLITLYPVTISSV
jgi:hypothetical protein